MAVFEDAFMLPMESQLFQMKK